MGEDRSTEACFCVDPAHRVDASVVRQAFQPDIIFECDLDRRRIDGQPARRRCHTVGLPTFGRPFSCFRSVDPRKGSRGNSQILKQQGNNQRICLVRFRTSRILLSLMPGCFLARRR
jgi:hypothetical protein